VSVVAAWLDGWRRIAGAPVLVIGVVFAMALAAEWQWVLHGASTWAPGVAIGHWGSWLLWDEPFSFGGFAGPLFDRHASYLVAASEAPLLAAVEVDVVIWMCLSGGAIDRLARGRRVGARAFFGASGEAFFRFLRLGVILGGANWILIQLLPDAYALAERVAPGAGVTVTAVVARVVIIVIAVIGDFAQVRMVVEDRQSAIGAVTASCRFIGRRLVRVVALLVLAALPLVLLMLAWNAATPTVVSMGSGALAAAAWIGLLIRTTGRLGVMAVETTFFQRDLAHAGYTAAPRPTWPDSPAVEAIADLSVRAADSSNRALPL
jgi:hypothetical protein